jgi:hypothetical protein
MADDLNFQNLSTVQNSLQPKPNTIASATTIAPVTFLTFVTGTLQVATITPPVTGQHMIALCFTDASPGTMLTTGNVLTAVVPTQNIPCLMFYDPNQAKYYGCANNLT